LFTLREARCTLLSVSWLTKIKRNEFANSAPQIQGGSRGFVDLRWDDEVNSIEYLGAGDSQTLDGRAR